MRKMRGYIEESGPDKRGKRHATISVTSEEPQRMRNSRVARGTEVTVSAPRYQPNFGEDRAGRYKDLGLYRREAADPDAPRRYSRTLFDYEPGTITDLYGHPHTPHTVGPALALAAQWHQRQGGERHVRQGFPQASDNLSKHSSPLVHKLADKGVIDRPQYESRNDITWHEGDADYPNLDLGREPSRSPGVFGQLNDQFARSKGTPVTHEIPEADMASARVLLRQTMGYQKKTAPIQTRPVGPLGIQGRLFR